MRDAITHDCALAILTGLAPSPLIVPSDPRLGARTLTVHRPDGTRIVNRVLRYRAAVSHHLAAKGLDDAQRKRAAAEIAARVAFGYRLKGLLPMQRAAY